MGLEDRLLLATAGALDSSFGTNGVATLSFQPPFQMASLDQSAFSVAIDPDGNIVMAGYVNSQPGTDPDEPATVAGESAAAGRLTPAGTPDADFSPLGQVVINTSLGHQNVDGPVDLAYGIVADSNGNILLNSTSDNINIGANTNDLVMVGYHRDDGDFSADPQDEFSIVALKSSSGGQFTDAFGNDTVKTVSFVVFNSNDTGDIATAGLLQPDGTILVTGSSEASTDQIPLARFNIDGSLDTNFGSATQLGTELLNVPGENSGDGFSLPDGIAAMAFQGSSSIILAGTATVDGQPEVMLVRLQASNDSIDSSFGDNGVELVPVPSGGKVEGLAVDAGSGRIVVAGSNYLAAFTQNGAADSTFGAARNGVVAVAGITVAGAALESDGSIVVAGSAVSSGKTIAALARYTSGGVPDPAFGPNGNGLVTTNIDSSGSSEFDAVAIEPSDGEIVAAGSALDPADSTDTAVVARYIGETPELTALDPADGGVGAASFTLTVTGDNFVSGSPGSEVLWNNAALTTTFVNATTLKATVPASDLLAQGTASITVTNPGDIVSNTLTFAIGKVTPTITWADPTTISYGTALSNTQLDAQASVAGKFSYTPSLGAILPPGSGQTISANFVPNNTSDYTDASDVVTIDVIKATPTLVAQGASVPYDGNSHPATFTITGTNGDNLTSLVVLTYNGSSAIPVEPGTYTVTATFSGNGDYNAVASQATISILVPPSAPQVTGIAIGAQSRKGITAITVLFDESMNSGSATSLANYQVFGAVKKKRRTVYTKFVGIRRVSYGNNAVTITLSKAYKGAALVIADAGILGADGESTSSPFAMTVS